MTGKRIIGIHQARALRIAANYGSARFAYGKTMEPTIKAMLEDMRDRGWLNSHFELLYLGKRKLADYDEAMKANKP